VTYIHFQALLLADMFLSHMKVWQMSLCVIKTEAIVIGWCKVVYELQYERTGDWFEMFCVNVFMNIQID
jgi:hypothetical protein